MWFVSSDVGLYLQRRENGDARCRIERTVMDVSMEVFVLFGLCVEELSC